MPTYDPTRIANLVGQLGGDHQQAARQLRQMGGQIDPRQHADVLRQMGIDPRKLQNGDYQQHLDAQDQPGFQGYRSGDMSGQSPQFGGQGGQGGQSQMAQMGQGQSQGRVSQGRGQMDQGEQNLQQFDQNQGGMRGMEPDPDQRLTDDQQMAGRQQRSRRDKGSRQRQGQGQRDYSGRQDR